MVRLIPLTVIAFLLVGSLLSCDSSTDGTNQPCDTCDVPRDSCDTCSLPCDTCDTAVKPVPPSWDQLRSLKFGKFQFKGAHGYMESIVNYIYKGHFGYGDPKWEFTYNEQIIDSANNKVSPLLTINPSRALIDSFAISHGQTISVCNYTGAAVYSYSIRGINIPLFSVSNDTVIFKLTGAIVKDHLETVSLLMRENSKCMMTNWVEAYQSTLWSDTITPPEIIITLHK